MASPPVTGFSVRITTASPGDDVPAPAWLSSGHAEPLHRGGSGDGMHWSGWALVGNPVTSPALSEADGVTVLLAGEIYHSDALRAAVGASADGITTDAELLLSCWLRYGSAGLRLINGRFAAVITEAGAVVAAADHAGGVPLYLRHRRGRVEIATEAKALVHDEVGGSVPVQGTDSPPGPAGVLRVRAGTAVTLLPEQGRSSAMRTWLPPEHRLLLPPHEAVRRVRDVLGAAVRTRLGEPGTAQADPVSVVLSGGIDSSSVVALARGTGRGVDTISLGTDAGDEFDAARLVSGHTGTRHQEFRFDSEDLVRQLPWVVAAAEIVDAEVLEYLLPLVVLYRSLPGGGRRIVTGYGADIPLGGMHRATERLNSLDEVIAGDMGSFDGLNEMSPVLGGLAGHWTTHPFWDRDVLDLLTALDPGLKRRNGRDKWVLREAMREQLPEATVNRPKLGIHEGSGATSVWSRMLRDAGVADADVPGVKNAMAATIHRRVVAGQEPPGEVSFDGVLDEVLSGRGLAVAR